MIDGGGRLKEVVLYSTGCPKCKVLKMKLDKKGIVYTENTDMDTMLALGLKSAPALEVGSELYDFNRAVKWVDEQGSDM